MTQLETFYLQPCRQQRFHRATIACKSKIGSSTAKMIISTKPPTKIISSGSNKALDHLMTLTDRPADGRASETTKGYHKNTARRRK